MVRSLTRSLRLLAALSLFALASTGCATVATGGGGTQIVTVTSTPPGAAVMVDGQPQGSTPAKVSLSRKSEHKIELSAPGHETAHLTITKKLNPWLLGNIVVGGIIGVAVDLATDATYTLSPSELQVHMKALDPAPAAATPASASSTSEPRTATH